MTEEKVGSYEVNIILSSDETENLTNKYTLNFILHKPKIIFQGVIVNNTAPKTTKVVKEI